MAVSVYVHQDGKATVAERFDPAWLDPSSKATVWVDLSAPAPEDGRLLSDVFHFHALSVEDAMSKIHHPKVEAYPGYLYLILHGIDFHEAKVQFATHDIDFFLGPNYLVTVHDGHSRSIAKLKEICQQHQHVLAEGPVALLHRIVDAMVDNYRPEVDALEEEIDQLEDEAIFGQRRYLVRQILAVKRNLAQLRRVLIPQRDAIGRLARREFPQISDEMTYRFRDVYDHLVRLTEEAVLFQDRVTGILEAHLSTVSNRLNQVMKVLTVMSTIFMPMTVLTGMWGMNVPLPVLPGGEAAQFWWITGALGVVSLAMLAVYRLIGWL